MLHFCSDSRLAFPRSDYTSLSCIALMFTTLHSLTVLWVVLSCYSVDAVQFRKQGFIAVILLTLHSIVVFQSAQPYYQMILCNSVNGRFISKSCIVQLGQSFLVFGFLKKESVGNSQQYQVVHTSNQKVYREA